MDARVYFAIVAVFAGAGYALSAWMNGSPWAGAGGLITGIVVGIFGMGLTTWFWERRPWRPREQSLAEHMDEQWRVYLRRKFDDEIAEERARDRPTKEPAV